MKSGEAPENTRSLALDLTKGIAGKYKFWESPQKVTDYNLETGIHFLNGYFENVLIDKFAIFSNGFLFEGKVATELLEAFADDVIAFITQETGIALQPDIRDTFHSSIEVSANLKMSSKFKQFSALGEAIAKTLKSYGHETPDYQISLIGLHCDVWGATGYRPTPFTFDRRAGSAHDKNLYFSSAPLKTADHLKILEMLEPLIT